MDEWSETTLWDKARLFMQRGLEEEREGTLFPFWAVLALELLARSTLAHVHPVLLADPREPDNILAVFGFRKSDRPPTSIPAKALFSRCAVVVDGFTTEDAAFCTRMSALRNEELHSGGPAFAGYPTGQWLGDYYRVCGILLRHLGRTFGDFLGNEGEAAAAESLVEASQAKLEKIVKDEIAAKRRAAASAVTDDDVDLFLPRLPRIIRTGRIKVVPCPACESHAVLQGDTVSISGPRATEDGIEQDYIIQPTRLLCDICGLELHGLPSLYAADRNLAAQFTVTEYDSPEDFYGIEIPSLHDYEYEYENE